MSSFRRTTRLALATGLAAALAGCGGAGGGPDDLPDGGSAIDAAWSTELLFSDDFESYPADSSLAGQGGWIGDDVLVDDRAALGSRVAAGQSDTGSLARADLLHPLPALDGDSVVELRFRAYAYIRMPLTDKAGVFLSAAGGADAGWLASKGAGLVWRFDLRGLTGNAEDHDDIFDLYDTPLTLTVVLDGHRGDAYGIYDTGTGPQETEHVAITADQLASLTAVLITQDYYEPTDHLGADFDELELRIQRPPAR